MSIFVTVLVVKVDHYFCYCCYCTVSKLKLLSCRTIFKGLDRYRPPADESVTYTVESLLKKRSHEEKILKFIRGTAVVSIGQCACKVNSSSFNSLLVVWLRL